VKKRLVTAALSLGLLGLTNQSTALTENQQETIKKCVKIDCEENAYHWLQQLALVDKPKDMYDFLLNQYRKYVFNECKNYSDKKTSESSLSDFEQCIKATEKGIKDVVQKMKKLNETLD